MSNIAVSKDVCECAVDELVSIPQSKVDFYEGRIASLSESTQTYTKLFLQGIEEHKKVSRSLNRVKKILTVVSVVTALLFCSLLFLCQRLL